MKPFPRMNAEWISVIIDALSVYRQKCAEVEEKMITRQRSNDMRASKRMATEIMSVLTEYLREMDSNSDNNIFEVLK